jgi:Protein of unknown function (DUF2480)
MDQEKEIVNKVANSGLVVLELDKFYRANPRREIDLRDVLFEGQILREKDFRDFIRQHDWTAYRDSFVAVYCSADAIIPRWAYMLLAAALAPYARTVIFGDLQSLEGALFHQAMEEEDWAAYRNARVLLKGCSKVEVPEAVYMEVTQRLLPFVSSLMYGEACSTVPVYKRPREGAEGKSK